jgi:hypothetical protein
VKLWCRRTEPKWGVLDVFVCVIVGSLYYVLHDLFYFSSTRLFSFLLFYPTQSCFFITFAHKVATLISYLGLNECIVFKELFLIFYRQIFFNFIDTGCIILRTS